MNKRGFTLVEIIVCIVIIVVIGTISFFGIRTISNNIRVNKLKDIEDEIMTAARIYMETNNEVSSRVYNSKQAVIVTLDVLVNEGLLDLTTTELDLDDVKDEYVVAALSATNFDSDDCRDLKMVTSWDETTSNAIFICSKSDGSVSIQTYGAQANNISSVKREVYYMFDKDNYVYFSNINTLYRIYYIDTDDSIVLYNSSSFGSEFPKNTIGTIGHTGSNARMYCGNDTGGYYYSYIGGNAGTSRSYQTSEVSLDFSDFENFFSCSMQYGQSTATWTAKYGLTINNTTSTNPSSNTWNHNKKIRLKSCMKITEGNGTIIFPYKLENHCT